MDILSDPGCVHDPGTYYSTAVTMGNSNATSDPLGDNYTKIKEFFQVQVEAMVVAAAMKHFDMEQLNTNITNLPFNITKESTENKRSWIYNEIETILDKHVTQDLQGICAVRSEVPGGIPFLKMYLCRQDGCHKIYKTKGGRNFHENKVHNLEALEPEEIETEINHLQDDHLYHYGGSFIALGLLLRNL